MVCMVFNGFQRYVFVVLLLKTALVCFLTNQNGEFSWSVSSLNIILNVCLSLSVSEVGCHYIAVLKCGVLREKKVWKSLLLLDAWSPKCSPSNWVNVNVLATSDFIIYFLFLVAVTILNLYPSLSNVFDQLIGAMRLVHVGFNACVLWLTVITFFYC